MTQNKLKKGTALLFFYNFLLFAVTLAYATLNLNTAYAGYKDDIEFTKLQEELDTTLPDGNGIEVAQIEAGDPWMPDPDSSQFGGKDIIDKSGAGNAYSGHATSVGNLFYGNTSSMTPGIDLIDSFSAGDWLVSGFLNTGNNTTKPDTTSARVANHSWIGSFSGDTYTSDALRRFDWLIDRDEYIQVAALSNGSTNQPLFSSSFNAVIVGRTDGIHGHGLPYVDETYTNNRVSPDIVAPMGTTSSATPVVASAAALLVHLGHENPYLSTDPELSYAVNRNEGTIYNAERSEVIKATLMAGADRWTSNSGDANIIDYRSDEANMAPNGLDSRYGAGQVNIYQSYHIIASGEQNSYDDDPDNDRGDIGLLGFDYDPCFGGEDDCNNTGSYYFSTDSEHIRLVVNLSWNLMINGGETDSFDGTAALYNLDLILSDITDADNPVIITSSESLADNSENIWILLEQNRDYLLEVVPGEGQGVFKWDYALAWHLTDSLGGDFKADEDVDGMDLADYISSGSTVTLKQFASDFGKVF
ncbi:MAG: hypothetical protein JJV92_08095, partial [Desulfosarcina sp.]|nr:hypothetical protein [Desulfobacterales bacterium]